MLSPLSQIREKMFNGAMARCFSVFLMILMLVSCSTVSIEEPYSVPEESPAVSQSERPFAEAVAAASREEPVQPAAEETAVPEPEAIPEEKPAEESAAISLPGNPPEAAVPEEPVPEEPAEAGNDISAAPEPEEAAPVEISQEPLPEPAMPEAPAEDAYAADAASGTVLASSVNPQMDEWMVQLMISSVAIIIIFTLATAVRNVCRMQLSRPLALVITACFVLLPITISAAIGGFSLIWLDYLVLAFSYAIFRRRGTGYLR